MSLEGVHVNHVKRKSFQVSSFTIKKTHFVLKENGSFQDLLIMCL